MKYLRMLLNLVGGILSSPKTGGRRLKYGMENGSTSTVAVTLGASVQLAALSSYFVTIDTSGNANLTTASNNTVFGALIAGQADLASSTAGATVAACNVALDAIYRIPVSSGTYARATNRGVAFDLVVNSNVQGAAIATNNKHHLLCLDGDETNNYWVIARINPAVILGQA